MNIRKATESDTPDLMRLYHALSARYQDNPEAIRQALGHASTVVFIAVADGGGQALGTATLSIRAVPSRGLVGYVDDVVVDPSGQGLGLGRLLSEHCLAEARTAGCGWVELTSGTGANREAANRLYQKLGFRLRDTNCYVIDL